MDRTGSQGQGMSKVWAPFLAYPWVWVSVSKKVICHSGTVHRPCFSDDPESVLVEKMPSYITQCVSRAEPCASAGGLPHSSQDTCSPGLARTAVLGRHGGNLPFEVRGAGTADY